MKRNIIVSLLVATLTLAQSAWAAGNRTTVSSRNASFESRQRVRQTHRPATITEQSVSGVIPRAIRGGQPLQMLNPFAPAKYGTADESVSLDPDVPGKVNGIKLVSISF